MAVRKIEIRTVVTIWFLVLFGVDSLLAQSPNDNYGDVEIVVSEASVFDTTEAMKQVRNQDYFPPFRIFLQNDDRAFEMRSRTPGKFAANVPIGFYDVRLKSNDGMSLSYRRGNIQVGSEEKKRLFIGEIEGEAEVCVRRSGFVAEPIAHSGRPSIYPPVQYEDRLVEGYNRMTIKYCERRITSDSITSYRFALVTYKNLTIYAEDASYDGLKFKLEGRGRVMSRVDGQVKSCIERTQLISIELNPKSHSEFKCEDIAKKSAPKRTQK
ncbi:MAG: hypothetical protein HOP17_16480 [Acidobacteria bacterium]|nr:hypothetical protein [Acidobacteriota bacterium]